MIPAELAAAAAGCGVQAAAMLVEPDRTGLLGLTALVRSGQLRVRVERTFILEEVAEAHKYVETGRVTGKVVLAMV